MKKIQANKIHESSFKQRTIRELYGMPPEPSETQGTLTKDLEAKQISSKNHRKIQVIYAETA